jgi:Phage integrase family
MSETKPRYFVEKPQKGGGILYYWQPGKALAAAGYKTVPLSRDRAAAIQQAEAINAKVDQWRGGLPVLAQNRHGTLPWLIEQYKQDYKYKNLRELTKTTREYHLRRLLKWSAEKGDPPMRTIKRSDAKALWMRYGDKTEGKGQVTTATHLVTFACMLWNFALTELEDQDVVDKNPFARLGFKAPPPRQVVWQPEQITAFIETALVTPVISRGGNHRMIGYAKSMADAVMIAHNTTLREGDVLALPESAYDGTKITWTPSKTRDTTGVTLAIPATPELKLWLDELLAVRRSGTVVSLHQQDRPLVINETTGRRYDRGAFQMNVRKIRKAAGLPDDLWFEDLRRTATVQLAEAGLTEAQIAAFGGWSATSVAQMMKVYRPTNIKMAEHGMAKLVEYRSKLKSKG